MATLYLAQQTKFFRGLDAPQRHHITVTNKSEPSIELSIYHILSIII